MRRLLIPEARLAQLRAVYPDAEFEQESVRLGPGERRQLETMTGAKVLSNRFMLYRADRKDAISYVTFFDAFGRDGRPVKVAVATAGDGRIEKVIPFTKDATDPIADDIFLARLAGKRAKSDTDWVEGLGLAFPEESRAELARFAQGVRATSAIAVAAKSLSAAHSQSMQQKGEHK